MKISISTIKGMNSRYGTTGDIAPNGTDDLAEKIGSQLGAIEEVVNFGAKYDGIVVARVVSCQQHPDADRLHVVKLDDGGAVQGIDRDQDGYVQVVCGAPNVRQGLMVAWLPPGSTVPESADKEPFVLESRPLRGVISNGMLASPRELALGDSHEGIFEINVDVNPGANFGEYFGLTNDSVLDIENKMFTHRPDCFGFLGVSRELAGIQGLPFTSPDWYRPNAEVPAPEAETLPFDFRNEVPELVPRFTAIVMRDIEVKPSPTHIQIALAKVGLRPINKIVDYTDFFMLETGQPLHAYDYDKVKAQDGGDTATIVVRHPHQGEKITLLNGKEVEPRAQAITISTETKLIGIGGVMGGADTEVDENTKNIIIEVANFDMYSVRRTSMAHGLFTDAVTRFNKGQSPLQNRAVLAKVVDEIRQYAGGKVASKLVDDNHLSAETLGRGSLHPSVTVTSQFINKRLGLALSAKEMRVLLENVEFAIQQTDDTLSVTAPFWRTDIETAEDIVEEVGRLYGFDRLPLELPQRPLTPTDKNDSLEFKQQIREALSAAGANEVLLYSFVHGDLLRKAGQDPNNAYRLSNALSPDLQYYRQSLIPSLLERIHPNVKAGYGQLALFEIGKTHIKGQLEAAESSLPKEFERVALVFAADEKHAGNYQGAAYYQAKAYLESVLRALRIVLPVRYEPITGQEDDVSVRYLEPGRAATIVVGNTIVGHVGEYRTSVRRELKLPAFSAGFELRIEALRPLVDRGTAYKALSRFPGTEQDVCLKVSSATTFEAVYSLMQREVASQVEEHMIYSLSPVDIYQRSDEADFKQITIRLSITSHSKTLRDTEVTQIMDHVAQVAVSELAAERI